MPSENFEHSRNSTKITLDKVSSWEELNAATQEEADKKFNEKTKETWKDFVVSGVLQFDKKERKQVLKPFTDLDGKCALGILKESGIDTSNLVYIKPGEYLKGAINLDTGDKFGVVYEEPTYTAYFDHHASDTKEVISTTEIVYRTMVDLKMMEKSDAMDRVVDFVTKIDNRKFPPEEFLKSAKTILGLQRDLDFDKLLAYFKDHKNPIEELKPEEFEHYGLKESAKKQQETVDEAMKTLEQMEKEGWIINTKYGKILMNFNNRLKVGASAAYVKYDGIINYGGNGFAITLKNRNLEGLNLSQGKLIRKQMWIYNEEQPLRVSPAEILRALGTSLEKKEGEPIELTSYNLKNLHPPYRLSRPADTAYYMHVDYPDSAITGIKEKTNAKDVLSSQKRIVEASLYAADSFIQHGSLEAIKKYFDSWKEIKSPKDMTFHEIKWRSVPASDGWGYTDEMYVFPDFYEYLAFSDDKNIEEIKNEVREKTFQMWLEKENKSFRRALKKYPYRVWVGDLAIDGANNQLWISSKRVRNDKGWVDRYEQNLKESITFSAFEKLCREIIK